MTNLGGGSRRYEQKAGWVMFMGKRGVERWWASHSSLENETENLLVSRVELQRNRVAKSTHELGFYFWEALHPLSPP